MARISISTIDGIRVVKILDKRITTEDVSHDLSLKFTELVNRMIEPALIVDLGCVAMMTSSMIGKLIKLRNQCNEKKIKLGLCCFNKTVGDAIGLARIDTIIDMFDDHELAIEHFRTCTG